MRRGDNSFYTTLKHGNGGSNSRQSRPAAAPELTLLVRAYCHLCDEMRAALQPLADAAGARVTEIDVDADPALEARFGDSCPVLLLGSVDGIELCHYRLDTAARRERTARRAAVTVAFEHGFR